ncbi:MAG TPA: cytochrome c [Thermodesulfovibrionia bacterium]|nr:cytochrome c [Thermodesulfovibrionia bacterium]
MENEKKGLPSGVVALFILVGAYVFMRFIIRPPFPSNLTNFYMLFILAGVIIYITLEDKRIQEFLDFISLKSKEPSHWDITRKAVLVLIPFLAAYNVYSSEKITYAPSAELFAPHVTPPKWVVDLKVPEWAADVNKWDTKHIDEGKKIYEANCVPCHGENADGKGPMASAIRYPASPTNFQEPGTIAQLPLGYVFWRVRDGGIFDKQFKSAMPGWSDELDDDEMWKVIMYAYTKAGVKPRTWE